ncbi:MAG: M3 family peptidase, partial [Sphingomicrobium sp.]
MKRMVLAGSALVALGGCAAGNPYTGVEAGPAAVAEAPAAVVVPATIPVPDNVLLADWTGPYGGVPPWDRVKITQFPEAPQFSIEEQRREIAAIADNAEAPTFDNSIVALEKSGQRLNRVGTIYGLYSNNLSSPEFQAVEKEWDPKLSAASDEVTLNPKLFQRIKAVYDSRAGLGLDAKQLRLVEKTYESYVRNGANLEPAPKEQLAAINQQLASAFGSFSN